MPEPLNCEICGGDGSDLSPEDDGVGWICNAQCPECGAWHIDFCPDCGDEYTEPCPVHQSTEHY